MSKEIDADELREALSNMVLDDFFKEEDEAILKAVDSICEDHLQDYLRSEDLKTKRKRKIEKLNADE